MFSYNIVLIGDSGVGKSTFFIQFFNHTFQEKSIATIGIEYHKTEMNVEGVPVIIHIYDTAGQEKYKVLTNNYYKKADGIVLMYSVEDIKSIKEIENWFTNIQEKAKKEIAIALVANKVDLPTELIKVDEEEGEMLAKTLGISFYQISSKKYADVVNVIKGLIKELLKNEDVDTISNLSKSTVRNKKGNLSLLSNKKYKNKKIKCC